MASYNWLRATLLQSKESEELTEKDKRFIKDNLNIKDQDRSKKKAREEFIKACFHTWNTSDCLKLLKEGIVPYDIFNDIIQRTSGFTNKVLSIFSSKTSLQNLIGAKNIAILKHGNKCIALDPSDKDEENEKKIKGLINNVIPSLLEQRLKQRNKSKSSITKDMEYNILYNLDIITHGSGMYATEIDEFSVRKNSIILFLSNIPQWGLFATNNGCKKRAEKYKKIVDIVYNSYKKIGLQHKNNKDKKERFQEQLMLLSNSYGNLLMSYIAKNLLKNEELTKIDGLDFITIAKDNIFYQTVDDICNVIYSFENKQKLSAIYLPISGCFYHPLSQAKKMAEKISDKFKDLYLTNRFYYSPDDREFFQSENYKPDELIEKNRKTCTDLILSPNNYEENEEEIKKKIEKINKEIEEKSLLLKKVEKNKKEDFKNDKIEEDNNESSFIGSEEIKPVKNNIFLDEISEDDINISMEDEEKKRIINNLEIKKTNFLDEISEDDINISMEDEEKKRIINNLKIKKTNLHNRCKT